MGEPYGLHLNENCLMCKLRSDGFFCDLPKPVVEAFERIKYATAYPADAVLFMEGQSPRGIYVLCSGKVKLSLTSSAGKTMIVKLAEPGEVLGLHACISGKPHDITAETTQPSQVNFVKREDFLHFLREHGSACLQAAEHLSAEHQNALHVIQNLALSHSAAEKLAHLLLESSAGGEKTAEGVRFKMALTHEELGESIGTSRETVTRLLAQFKKQKLIETRGASMIIRDKAGLEKMVGS